MPGSPFAALWPLDPAVDYLNHGSFGACPHAVLEHQSRLRLEMERELVDFLWRELPRRLSETRQALGRFVGASPDDLAWVSNATTGVNAVLRSLDLHAGDELLTTDHVYGACRRTLEHVAARAGARVVVANIPFPLGSEDEVVGPLLAAVTPATRLALVDQVTSPTGLVFPVSRIVRELEARGVDTLVDAAHALGMLPLELDASGAAYTTANAHKWLCAPKGAAFLHVRRNRQRGVHPLSISHAYDPGGGRFREEFDWTGTDDPTPFLTIPECLRYLGSLLPGGWPELMAANRALALQARDLLCETLGQPRPAPDSMIGALASVPLPPAAVSAPGHGLDPEGLQSWCRARGVETWFAPWQGKVLVRVSPQLYNARSQYQRLGSLLLEALG